MLPDMADQSGAFDGAPRSPHVFFVGDARGVVPKVIGFQSPIRRAGS
jgi:hypothetical protein